MRPLWIGAVVLAGTGVAAASLVNARDSVPAASVEPVRAPAALPSAVPVRKYRVNESLILARNLFSSSRRPPSRRFDPMRGRTPENPLPSLVLEGVVGGAEPSALIQFRIHS